MPNNKYISLDNLKEFKRLLDSELDGTLVLEDDWEGFTYLDKRYLPGQINKIVYNDEEFYPIFSADNYTVFGLTIEPTSENSGDFISILLCGRYLVKFDLPLSLESDAETGDSKIEVADLVELDENNIFKPAIEIICNGLNIRDSNYPEFPLEYLDMDTTLSVDRAAAAFYKGAYLGQFVNLSWQTEGYDPGIRNYIWMGKAWLPKYAEYLCRFGNDLDMFKRWIGELQVEVGTEI